MELGNGWKLVYTVQNPFMQISDEHYWRDEISKRISCNKLNEMLGIFDLHNSILSMKVLRNCKIFYGVIYL